MPTIVTVTPTLQDHGGWDYNATWFTPSTASMTSLAIDAVGDTNVPSEAEYSIFDTSLTYQQLSALSVGDVKVYAAYTLSTSDPFDKHNIHVETSLIGSAYKFPDGGTLGGGGAYGELTDHGEGVNSAYPSDQVIELQGATGKEADSVGPNPYGISNEDYYSVYNAQEIDTVPLQAIFGDNYVTHDQDVTEDILDGYYSGRHFLLSFFEDTGGVSYAKGVSVAGFGFAQGVPTLGGFDDQQTVSDTQAYKPFGSAVFFDDSDNPQETVSLTMLDANGIPSDSAGVLTGTGDFTKQGTGSYRLTSDAQSLASKLQQLTFKPLRGEVGSTTPVYFNMFIQSSSGDTESYNEEVDVQGSLACYCTGTMIATTEGGTPIDALAVGDLVVTASGDHRPVNWIGHRHLDLTRHPDPQAVWPIRVAAGAFADGLPARDLWLSPGHNVFVCGVLIAAKHLVNGATITQVPVDAVTYWHVELDSHDILLAEGLPAESYLDTGNRTALANGGAFVDMHPTFEPKHERDTCAPIVKSGPEVEAAKALLLARADELGHVTTALHDLHVVADGCRIDAFLTRSKRLAFALPAGVKSAALASRTFVPSHMKPDSSDTRVLGVAVTRLQVDGEEIHHATLNDGWHALEQRAGSVRRWTTGKTPIPAGARLVIVDLVGEGRYRIARRDNVVALRA